METDEEQEAPVFLVTPHVNKILDSIFSNAEVYINNQQFFNSHGPYAHKSYNSKNFKGAISKYQVVLHCEGYDYEEYPDDIMKAPLFDFFFRRRLKMLSRPDGFMFYGKLVVDFFSTSELLYPNLKIRLQLITARSYFYMISDNPNISLRFVLIHSTLLVLLSRKIITKKDWTCLHMLLWSSTIWRF